MTWLRRQLEVEARRFLVVGGMGFGIDVVIFNLWSIVGASWGVPGWPIVSKTFSTVIAVSFTYVANSRWTFKERRGRPEGFNRVGLYVFVNIIGWLIIISSLSVSRYVLGFDTLLADNISANIIGVGLATLFRFWANRKWVFITGGVSRDNR